MATIGGPDSRDLGQENPERIRQSSEYKTFEGIFKDLSIPKTAKKYSGLYESQADFIRVLKQEMEKWGQGPRQEAAKLFIVDFESKIKGGKKGGRETIATDEEEESGGGKKGRKNKERKPKRGEEAAVVDMGATAKDLGIATKVPREVLTVEAVALVNEAVQEQEAETGHPITLAEYRQLIMDWFPRLAVRTGGENRKTNEQYSNLDGNACLFLFRQVFGFAEGTPAEQDYVFKEVAYVAPGTFQPGALNMDTSPGLHGIEIDDVAFYIDHHGIDSPRESSAFQILYEEFKREGMDKHLSPEDRTALDRLSEFVTAVDSYSLPPGQTWEKSWQLSYNTIFGLATSYQNEVRVSILFDFFKQHTLEEAFTLPIDKTTEPYLQGFRDLVEEDRREKTKTNNFVLDVKTSPTSVGFAVAIPGLGKILVHRQEVSKDKRTTNKKRGLQMAALAAGYDGILVFDEKKKSVFLAVGANTEITEDIAQRIKADLLVRKSLLKKSSKEGEEELTLAAVLLGLGANKEGLPVLIKRQMEEIEGKASTSATTPDVPPVETTKGMPTGTETGGAGPGPATPEVPSGTEPGGKKETLPEEKFKKYILDSLQAGNGRISPGVLANESFIHDVVTYWDTFSAAVKEYRDTTGEKTIAWGLAVDAIYDKMTLALAQEPLFNNWLLRMRIDDNLFPKFVDRVKEKDYPLYKFLRERILGLEAEPPSEGLGDVINFNPAEALQTTGGVFNPGELIYRKDLSSSPTNKATVEGYVVKGGVQYYKIKENKEFLFSEKILAWYIFPVDEAPKSPDFPRPPEIFGSINPLEEKPFKEPSREGERAEEPTREEEEAEPVKEVYNSERLRELSQGGESPDVANARLGTARQEFVSLYKEYLAAKKSTAKVDSLKNKLFFWKKGGKKAVATSEEVMDAKVKMEVAREAYLLAKQEYGRAVFQEKVRELVEAGLSPDEVAWELNNFNGRLFNSLMLKEEAELNKSKAVDWPAKERGFLRKGFDWYIKQHWTVRVLVTTGLFTGAIFGGSAALGVAMGSTIGAYAATRLLRSGTAAGLGQMFGKVIDAVMSHSIENYVKTNLWHATVDLVESGGNPKEVFDEMWAKQNKIFEARKKKEKIKLLSKVGVMIATGLGVYGISMALMPSAAEAGEQAAAAALKEASEHGGAVSAGARAAVEVPHGTGAGAAAESPSGTGAGEAVGDANAEPSAEELYQKAQDISDRYGRGQERFLESMHQKTEAALTQTRLDQLATLHKGEGVIAVFRRQLEAMPEKFGFTGDMSDVDAIHNWAEKQAAALSIKEGYWDPTTGKQVWTRWDPNTTVRFNVEGDVEHGLKVAESGTEGSKFIYEPTTAATEVFGKGVSTAGRGVLEAAERTGAVAKAAAARGLEATPPPPLPVVEGAAGLSPEAPGVIDVAHTVSDFPKDVQPYAIYLEAKVKAAQVLLEQYASDPVLGPAARNAFDQVRDDIGAFVKNVDAGKLDAYKGFSGTGFNVVEELRGAIEKVAGVKLPGAEAVASTDVFDMAGLLKGGRIAIEKSWGLKFETVGGRVTPIIDAPRADIDRVVEAHAGMKTDGWLNKDSLNSLIERNDHLASVPQIRLAQIDYLIRALDHLKDTGAGLSEAAGVVKRTIRVMMGNISETVNKVPEDIFTRAFLDRVK